MQYFCRHGRRYQQKHLNNCLLSAQERHNKKAKSKILVTNQKEKDQSYCCQLNYSMSKARGHSVRVVQTSGFDRLVMEYDNQRSAQEAISKGIHDNIVYFAEQAPICQGRLRGEFGYMATTPAAKQVLDGTYEYPTQ